MVELILMAGFIIGNVLEYLLVALFVSLTWTASMGVEAIAKDVESHLHDGDRRVVNWKRNYCLILELIAEVDEIFGPSLLIFIATQFVMFVLYSFTIVFDQFRDATNYYPMYYMAKNILSISLVVLGSQTIKAKAR